MLNRVLAAALALQVVVLAVVFWPESSPEVGALFPDVEQDRIASVTITGPQGSVIEVSKGDGGCVLPQADDYPCRAEQLRGLLDKIADLQADNLVTRTPSSHLRLRVSPSGFERMLEFETYEGERRRLYIGAALTVSASHVRADDQAEVYKVSDLTTSDAPVNAASWIDTEYLAVDRDNIQSLTIENADGRLALLKDDQGEWTLEGGLAEGEIIDTSKINSLLTRAASVSARAPLGRGEEESYGFAEPQLIYTVEARDDAGSVTARTLTVGGQGDGVFYAKSDGSDYYVLISSYEVNDLIDADRAYVLEPPPAPTPEPTMEPEPTPTPSG